METKGTSPTTDPRSVWVCSATLLQYMMYSTMLCLASCKDPDHRVQKLVSNRDLWDFDISSRIRRLFWPSITVCNQFKRVFLERNLD